MSTINGLISLECQNPADYIKVRNAITRSSYKNSLSIIHQDPNTCYILAEAEDVNPDKLEQNLNKLKLIGAVSVSKGTIKQAYIGEVNFNKALEGVKYEFEKLLSMDLDEFRTNRAKAEIQLQRVLDSYEHNLEAKLAKEQEDDLER